MQSQDNLDKKQKTLRLKALVIKTHFITSDSVIFTQG